MSANKDLDRNAIAGLLYLNVTTAEMTDDQDLVLKWISVGQRTEVIGYVSYEWQDSDLQEVWHIGWPGQHPQDGSGYATQAAEDSELITIR